MRRFRRLGITIIFRDEFKMIKARAKEVDGLARDYADDTAYIYNDIVYIFSRDGRYYTRLSLKEYRRSGLKKREVIVL